MAAIFTYVSKFLSGDLEPFWPHVVLLSCSVLASIAVGAGIIFQRPKYSASIHRVAFWLVVSGVIIEAICTIFLFVFDEGISNAQQSRIASLNMRAEELRAENLKLEAQIAPRRLSPDNIAALKKAVRPFANRQVSIWSYGIDLEARILAKEILSALSNAQVPTVDRIGNMISSTEPRIGVIVSGPDDLLIQSLLKALKPVSAVRGPYTSDNEFPVPAEIFVGIKPVTAP
jgi:hypothetical protein